MHAAATHFDLAPHCSLSTRGALLFFASMCCATFAVAGLATFLGFWPVLPFAGAEMLLLGWALKSNMARRHQHEIIEITEREVVIEFVDARGPAGRVVFPRHWARVKILGPKSPRSSLVIESHGRACELGKFLTEDERHRLAAQLRLLIGGMNQSPALPAAGSPDQFS